MSGPQNVVREIRRATRRRFSAEQKIQIVLEGLRGEQPVSELCRREGINPTMYYTWKKKLLASAGQVFDEKPKKADAERERRDREMSRMKDVIAEITAENLELKKTLSG